MIATSSVMRNDTLSWQCIFVKKKFYQFLLSLREFCVSLRMPRRTKRQRQVAEIALNTRESLKKPRLTEIPPSKSLGPSGLDTTRDSSLSSDPTDIDEDSNFDTIKEMNTDPSLKLELFMEEWVQSLCRDDKISLDLFLTYNFEQILDFYSTRSAEYAPIMMGKSEQTIRKWRSD